MEYFEMPSGDIMSVSALRKAGIDDEKIMQIISISMREKAKKQKSTIDIETLERFALRYKIVLSMSGEEVNMNNLSDEELNEYIDKILNDNFYIENLKKIHLDNFDKDRLFKEIKDIYIKDNLVVDVDFIKFVNSCNEEKDLCDILMKIDNVKFNYDYDDEDLYEKYMTKSRNLIKEDKYYLFRKHNWTDDYMDKFRLIKLYEMSLELQN